MVNTLIIVGISIFVFLVIIYLIVLYFGMKKFNEFHKDFRNERKKDRLIEKQNRKDPFEFFGSKNKTNF